MQFIKLSDLFSNIKIWWTPSRAKQEYFWGWLPWVSIRDLWKTNLILETKETLSDLGVRNSNVKLIKKGSLLFSFKLSVWKVAFAWVDLYTNEAIASFEPGNPKVDLHYLYYCLPIYAKKNARTNNYWAPLLNKEIIKDLQIPLPSLEVQESIVAKLDKLTELIDLKKEAIGKTEELTKSVFLEMFGDISRNEKGYKSELFWDILSIDAKMVSPLDTKYQDLFCIWWANIVSETWDLIDLNTAKQEWSISGKFLVSPDDILYSKIRPKLKKITFPQIECLCSADIYPLRPNKKRITHHYLIEYLLSSSFTAIVSEMAEKRAQIPKINREELLNLKIPVPPLELQVCFESFVNSQLLIKKNQEQSLLKLQALHNTTVQKIFV
ncbi:MAG: Restriction endonuclease S subunit [uncultured bacterium (gcode 4)]|uniref:Restriction endonuclease S subunit n=1 Tax=uncultured bacterium (gcode 4) TaxID=1234023 RepID=K1ZJA3_9BACT|nr:MAG: Restriction endonuclease S subunit [uncultured bacterium (gcode 4)]